MSMGRGISLQTPEPGDGLWYLDCLLLSSAVVVVPRLVARVGRGKLGTSESTSPQYVCTAKPCDNRSRS